MANALQQLADTGVAVWLDDLSRARIQSGELARMVEHGVVGITTNPTIFAKAIGSGSGYEEQVHDLALRGTAVGETVRLLTAWDVRAACDVLHATATRTSGRDGRVSIEVDPRVAQDAARTAAEARGLWWLVDRPNLFIKIPATLAGLPAITETLSAGISVNVTLIFSVERYRAVLDAFLSGLEQRLAGGGSLERLESVASFFVSRIDVEVDRQLDAMTHDGVAEAARLRGKAAIANAQLAYEVYEDAVASPRWQALQAKGGRMQRLLWASTGVKDKAYNDTRYVVDLAAQDAQKPFVRPIRNDRYREEFPPQIGRIAGREGMIDALVFEQLVRLLEPARGFSAAAQLAVLLLPLCDAGDQASDVRDRCHLAVLRVAAQLVADQHDPPRRPACRGGT